MVKQTRKRRNTSEKLATEFCDGSTDVEPVDLGNDKQNKKRKGDAKGKKFEKSDGNVKKVVKDKRTNSSKQTKAIFTEDDEIVQMEVGEEEDKEFVGDDEEYNSNEYDKEDTGDTEEEGINEDGELSSSDEEEEEIAEIRSGRSSLDSHVVSFNRSRMGAECSSATSSSNNNNWEKSGGLGDWDPEEEKHMMKFAKFLEAKGFIRNTEENCNPIPTMSGKGKGKGKKTNPGQEKDCRLREQCQEIQQQDSKKGEAATQAVRPLTAEERVKQMLKQAENAKAKMMPVPDYTNKDLKNVITPVNVEVLEQLLKDSEYDKKETHFLVHGFRHGFDIGYRGPWDQQDTSNNIPLQRFLNALKHIFEYQVGKTMVVTNYLDDFLFVSPTRAGCNALLPLKL